MQPSAEDDIMVLLFMPVVVVVVVVVVSPKTLQHLEVGVQGGGRALKGRQSADNAHETGGHAESVLA
jgi:hypothetical protein